MIITTTYNGQKVSKETAKIDITHVVVSMYQGKPRISGMFKNKMSAEKRIIQAWTPEFTAHKVCEVESGAVVATIENRKRLGALVGI